MVDILVRIFCDVYTYYYGNNREGLKRIHDTKNLEESLKEYLKEVYFYYDCEDYKEYYKQIRKYFENLVENFDLNKTRDLNTFIKEYTENFYKEIDKRELSSKLFVAIKNVLSNNPKKVIIRNKGKSYFIEKIRQSEEDPMPVIGIRDIDSLEQILNNFLDTVLNSDTYFNSFFGGMERDEAISYLFEWVIRNATSQDLSELEKYFQKYTGFISDKTLEKFKKPILADRDFLGQKLGIMLKKSNVNYETPYYLSFVMFDGKNRMELPNIRFGVENNRTEKIVHILATQTSQDNNTNDNIELIKTFKTLLGRTKYFREYNPTHLISIALSFGIFKGLGINKVNVVDYMPLRFQRLALEGNKNEEELYNLQYRLTNKNLYNYLRLCEFCDGIEIISYLENGELSFNLTDHFSGKVEILEILYSIGYNIGISNKNELEVSENKEMGKK